VQQANRSHAAHKAQRTTTAPAETPNGTANESESWKAQTPTRRQKKVCGFCLFVFEIFVVFVLFIAVENDRWSG